MLLLAKSAFAATPHSEMRRIAEMVAMMPGVAAAVACYSEQGQPSLRDALLSLRGGNHEAIILVPLVLPLEPSFLNWITRSLRRWQSEHPGGWPPIRVSRDIAQSLHFELLLAALINGAAAEPAIPADAAARQEGSLVPPQKRRVLVCEGGACNAAGADAIWGHLRNVQVDRKLRVTGDGTMTAKATCLGPCNLAPVLQVFPEGTYYGGVTEAAVDRIVEEHLLGGRVVQDFAYEPTGRKQRLRIVAVNPPTGE
ncbi:(2Fe-2S) ferredoxin domain-containing protein [Aminobacter sp. AP02]|uniref:(2Fe-2S) ferredoxin domain-containing protein n=1 Tax=Aminobacter sp. AP02 TaxID=2135737 RepID=UPI000D79533C|nr:(2Fe-2S) ferredoxin domain-containing protein [Aminobacter sp. AP02]PWK60792.1 NADH:ubiquinone oxidoreductase subunit E [Aminobacter sp. AP02]